MRLSTLLSLGSALLFLGFQAMGQSEDQAFDLLSSDFLKGYFAANPINATYIGVHEYDNILDDIGQAAVEKEIARLKQFQRHLAGIDQPSLSKDKSIDYRILLENTAAMLFGLRESRE